MKRVTLLLYLPLLSLLPGCSRDPKVVRQKYLDNANKYFDKGRYKEASIMYRRALQRDGRFGEAWYRLGLTDLALKKPGDARRDFMRAWETGKILDALVKQADLDWFYYDQTGDKDALKELQGIIADTLTKEDPYDAFRLAGYLAVSRHDVKQAIQSFDRANRIKPDQPEVVSHLVEALFSDGQFEPGEKYAREMIARQKTLGVMYELLYRDYATTNRPELGEQVLKEKIANIPGQGSDLVELALHYFKVQRKSDMTATLGRLTSDLKTYPDARMLAGDFYFVIRDFDAAIEQYQQGEQDDRKQKPAYEKRMARVFSAEGKNDQAAKVIDSVLKDNSKDPEAIVMHAELLLQSGNREQIRTAINELKPLVATMPTNVAARFDLSRAYLAIGDAESLGQAQLQLEQTVKLQPGHISAKMAVAELALKRGDNRKALDTSAEVLALQKYDPGALKPGNLGPLLVGSLGLMNMGENEKARARLNTIVTAYPKFNDAHYWLARLDLKEKRYPEAEAGFAALRKVNDPRWLGGTVDVKVAQNDSEGALSVLREQLKQTPDSMEDLLNLANIEYQAAKWPDAAKDFQKLIDKNPKSPAGLYIRLGESRRYSGDLNAAIEAFKKAHEADPNNVMPILQLGMLYDTSGKKEEARKSYEDVLKLQPDNGVALNNLAYAKADEGVDLDQALTYAQRAQQKVPDSNDVIDTLSLIYIRKNLTDDSIRLLKDLVAKNPERSTYHLHLAMAYYQKGNRALAKKELDLAARAKPSEKEQTRIKEMLAKVG